MGRYMATVQLVGPFASLNAGCRHPPKWRLIVHIYNVHLLRTSSVLCRRRHDRRSSIFWRSNLTTHMKSVAWSPTEVTGLAGRDWHSNLKFTGCGEFYVRYYAPKVLWLLWTNENFGLYHVTTPITIRISLYMEAFLPCTQVQWSVLFVPKKSKSLLEEKRRAVGKTPSESLTMS